MNESNAAPTLVTFTASGLIISPYILLKQAICLVR